MSIQDALSLILIVFLVSFVTCIIFVTFYLVKALKSITSLVDNWDDTTQGLKNKLKLNFLTTIPAIILAVAGRLLRKRG